MATAQENFFSLSTKRKNETFFRILFALFCCKRSSSRSEKNKRHRNVLCVFPKKQAMFV